MYSKQILWFLLFPLALSAQNRQWKKLYRAIPYSSNFQVADSGFIFREARNGYRVKINWNGTITERNWDPKSLERHHNSPTSDGGNLFFTREEVRDTLDRQEPETNYPQPRLRFPTFTLHKTNRQGRTEWIKKYPDTLFLFNAIQTLDSGYLIHGRSYEGLHFFQKLDAQGQLIWQKHRIAPRIMIMSQWYFQHSIGSFTNTLLSDGGFAFFGMQETENNFILTLWRMDSVGNILWDELFQRTWRIKPQIYLNQHQDFTWLEASTDTIALVQWQKEGRFAQRTVIPLPIRPRLTYSFLAQRKKGGFWLVYGTKEQSYLVRLDDYLNIISRKTIPYYMNLVRYFGELDENRLYFVSYESELQLTVTDMEGNIAQNYIYGSLQARCPSQTYRDWTIAAIRSDGKTYTTKMNTSSKFEFFVDTGRYTIRAYAPKDDWTVWETDVASTRRYQRDTTVLLVRCKDTPHLSLDIGTPSLHACQENEYVIQYGNSGTRGVSEGFLEVTLDSLMTYVASSLPVVRHLGRTLRFSLGPIHATTSNQIKLKVHLGCGDSFRLGAPCRVKAVLYPDSLETHLDMKISEMVPNSHDLQAEIRENLAAIDYTLRFGGMQKDTLSMVAFRDTLSEWLDPSTIEILSSNPVCIWELVDGSILQLQVLGALLPNQYGFVKFRVKPKANIPKNTLIQHRASLLLNFEPPISIRSQIYWQRH